MLLKHANLMPAMPFQNYSKKRIIIIKSLIIQISSSILTLSISAKDSSKQQLWNKQNKIYMPFQKKTNWKTIVFQRKERLRFSIKLLMQWLTFTPKVLFTEILSLKISYLIQMAMSRYAISVSPKSIARPQLGLKLESAL